MKPKDLIKEIKEKFDKYGYDKVSCSEDYILLILESNDPSIKRAEFHPDDKDVTNIVCYIKYKGEEIPIKYDIQMKPSIMNFEHSSLSLERKSKFDSIKRNQKES